MANELSDPAAQPSIQTGLDAAVRAPRSIDPMRSFNRWCAIIIGIFFVSLPWPMLGPDWWIVGLVCVHTFLFVCWFYYQNVKLSFLITVMRAAIYTYGISSLLIAMQIRYWVQGIFMNPLFVFSYSSEVSVPIFCILGMVFGAIPFWLLVTLMKNNASLGITLGVAFWSCLLGLMGYYKENVELIYYKAFPNQNSIREYSDRYLSYDPSETELTDLSSEQVKRLRKNASDLYQWSCVDSDGPSEAWCRKFKTLLTSRGGANVLNSLLSKAPEFLPTVHRYWDQQYNVDREMDSQQAWKTLERLAATPLDDLSTLRYRYVVESVAPHLDSDQLIDRIVNTDRWLWPHIPGLTRQDEMTFNWRALPESTELKPFVASAWWLNHQQDEVAPDKYNQFGNRIGRITFQRDQAELQLDFHKHCGLFCTGRDFDEYLRRRNYWKLGPDRELGNTTIKRAEYRRIFLDSKGSREWRRDHRNRLLELARQSIKPIATVSKPRSKSNSKKQPEIALGEDANFLNFGRFLDTWSEQSHFELLFLDPPTRQQPSLGFEFWPEFDAAVEKAEHIHGHAKLSLRWQYLAKIWPESSVEMFVECYMKSAPNWRQVCLLGCYFDHVGLPRTIPLEAQSEILQAIKKRVLASGEPFAKGVHLDLYASFTRNEIESIDTAIAWIDSPASADAFVKVLAAYQTYHDRPSRKAIRFDSSTFRHQYDHWRIYNYYQPKVMAWRDRWLSLDCVTALAKHKDPQRRLVAIGVIRYRPIPAFTKLLETLRQDSNEEVRVEAQELAAFVDELRKKSAAK